MRTLAIFFIFFPFSVFGAGKAQSKAAPENSSRPVFKETRKGDLRAYARFAGTATAEDFFNVPSPFTGRVERVMSELFQRVTPKTVMARMVTSETAALLDATSEGSREQTANRWKGIFEYIDIMPQEQGLVVKIHAVSGRQADRNDPLFTVARRIVVIGRTIERIHSDIRTGQVAVLEGQGGMVTVTAVVKWTVPDTGGRHRAGLEITSDDTEVRPGMPMSGQISLGSSLGTVLVPRSDIIHYGGRKFMLLEVETGISTEDETEITAGTGAERAYVSPAAMDIARPPGQ
ncbi:MAG: hypothetical protein ABIG11_01955 [bacterium]